MGQQLENGRSSSAWRIAFLTPVAVAATFGWFVWRQSEGLPYEPVRTETFTVLAAT